MKCGVIGKTLKHSFSKEIHEKIGGYSYDLIELNESDVPQFFKEKNFDAINVTIPYKETVLSYLDEIDDTAKSIGSVNTIINRNGKLKGYNTDFYGMVALLKHARISLFNKKVLILGNGGTAKTARAVAKSLGADEIFTAVRKPAALNFTTEDYKEYLDAEIIINTTPVGMFPNTNSCPVNLTLFKKLLGVIDAVYNPIKTELIKNAEKLSIPCEGGLYMLVCQAVLSAELFSGEKLSEKTSQSIYRELLEKNGFKDERKTVFAVINGANLNMLGIREPSIYGNKTYKELVSYLTRYAESKNVSLQFFQSNHEGELIDYVQNCFFKVDGIIMNAGAFTHTSIALADALKAVNIPCVEVHLSDTSLREPYRQISYLKSACFALVKGLGFDSYMKAIDLLNQKIGG